MKAQALVNNLEKSTATEEANWSWFNSNLRKPRKQVLEAAELVLDGLHDGEDPELEDRVQIAES